MSSTGTTETPSCAPSDSRLERRMVARLSRMWSMLRVGWPECLEDGLTVAVWLAPIVGAGVWYWGWLVPPANADWLLAFFGGAATIAGFQLAALALILGLLERLHDLGRKPIEHFISAVVRATWWWFAATFASLVAWAFVTLINGGVTPPWLVAVWAWVVFGATCSATNAVVWAGLIAKKAARTGR